LTDHAVLQRGDNVHASIYGVVVGGRTSVSTTVTVTVVDSTSSQPRTTPAKIISLIPGRNATWKLLLPPHAEYGGDLTITASCQNCDNTTEVTISGLTYGDVWLCSGQR
jgi:hypothetical protein